MGISNRRTFEKHDKFQMYHKSNYSNYVSVTFTAVNEIKF